MKKLLTILVLAASVLIGYAQGTLNFANGAAGVNAPVSYQGSLISGSGYVADLFWGNQGTPTAALTAAGFNVGFATGGNAGYFFGGARSLPTTGTVTIQVRVWRVSD